MIGALIDGAIKRKKVVLDVHPQSPASSVSSSIWLDAARGQAGRYPPYISVIVPFPGVSPEDAERLLIKPLEVQLQTIQGVKHLNAVARQGAALVTLEFEPSAPRQKALDDVRSRTDLARGRFPPDAEPPIIQEARASPTSRSSSIVLHGQAPERELARISKDLKERLESSPGIQEAFESGSREQLLDVTIDPLRMEAYNVTATDLSAVIGRNNQLVPAGDLRSGLGMFAVKVPGVVQNPADIMALPIKKNGDRIVTIGDILGEVRQFKGAGLHHPLRRPARRGARRHQAARRQHPGDGEDHPRRGGGAVQARWPATFVKVDFISDNSELHRPHA